MTVTCPECLTKFNLDEGRIPEGGAKARCSRCQHVFQVQKPPPPEESFFSQGESLPELGEMRGYPGISGGFFARWKWVILIGLLVVVIGGITFYLGGSQIIPGFTSLGKYVEEKTTALKKASLNLPFLRKYLGLGDPSEGLISLEKVRGYYVEHNNLNKLFVVEGEAINHWKESRSFIKVKGALLDSKGHKVQEKEAYCGNILAEKDLKEMSREAIEKSLSSQFGISFSNVNILPNKGVPFMIVFMDLPLEKPQAKPGQEPAGKPGEAPPKLSDFTVEVVGSQKGSK